MPYRLPDQEQSLVVCIDFESVFVHFEERYKQCLTYALGREVTSKELLDLWDGSLPDPDEALATAIKINHDDQWSIPPIAEGAADLVAELDRLDCNVFMILRVDHEFSKGRENLLRQLSVGPKNVICVGRDATSETIINALKEIGAEAFLGGAWDIGSDCQGGVNTSIVEACASIDGLLTVLLDDSDEPVKSLVDGVETIAFIMDFPLLVWERMRQANKVSLLGD